MIFEILVSYLFRHYRVVKITTGLCYNHKMIKMNGFEFVELDDGSVNVTLPGKLNMTFSNDDILISFVKCLDLFDKEEQR